MRKPAIIILIFLLGLLIYSCRPVRDTYDANDLSYIYNPLISSLTPSYRIYNESSDISELSVRFLTNNLFFSEANSEGVPKASMVLMYRIFNMSMGRVPIDTAIFNISIRKETGKREYIYNVPLSAPDGSLYEVELLIRDLITGTRFQRYIQFDKRDGINGNNFRLIGHFDKREVYTPILREYEFINLIYPNSSVDSLYVKYYKPFSDVPADPYLLIPEKEIDLEPFKTDKIPNSDTLQLMFPKEGVYQFTASETGITGYTIFNFGNDFPAMRTPLNMIEPLIYLSNSETINEMSQNPRPKVMLDEFWVNTTGNIEQSRELIKIYYNRVLYSNLYFTSYKEGWRTDRGMIYIIYGPPDKVYKSAEGERWGYNRPQIKSGWGIRYRVEADQLFFSFKRRENPFSDNDYTLLRSESLTTFWEQAVRSWREGVVFRLDNPVE